MVEDGGTGRFYRKSENNQKTLKKVSAVGFQNGGLYCGHLIQKGNSVKPLDPEGNMRAHSVPPYGTPMDRSPL